MEENTICAISTPIGVGGISIIRISGKDAVMIADKLFVTNNNLSVSDFEPRKLYFGTVTTKNFQEKCLCVYFKAPASYTGEDIVEFQCHGGIKLAYGVLDECIASGAKLAEAGEFTKRAFLNGKLSLEQAEGVIDVINSESDSQIRAGYNLMQGRLKSSIDNIQSKLTDCLAKLEVSMDYPEEDLDEETKQDVSSELLDVKQCLSDLYATSSYGMCIKNGTKVVILGKTNVGKSSLMNAMLNFDRAIVTNIQGTTRDTLEESYEYKGVKFNIVDTAGIRESEDLVENIGIEKSKNSINVADIILFVVDGSKHIDNYDREIIKLLKNKNNVLLVVNKSDLKSCIEVSEIPFENKIYVSAKNNDNITELKETIYSIVFDNNVKSDGVMLTNMRHINVIKEAIQLTNHAIDVAKSDINLDLISLDIKNIWLKLGEITGESGVEKIIDTIFSKFCVGK